MPFREQTLQSADEIRINSWPGFEIRARAKDPRGNAVSIVQWVRFAGSGFVRIIGTAPVERWDEIFTRFRAVRDGIELR
jgi:hypothetical protein